jgi:hypothetical protein
MNSLDQLIENNKTSFNPEENFGWLEPNGTYHPLPWGSHTLWATRYLLQNFPPNKENMHLYKKTENDKTVEYRGGDVLIYSMGWVLLHNPDNKKGMPKITASPSHNLTKEQREFLYMHFQDRGMKTEANDLYKDDNRGIVR